MIIIGLLLAYMTGGPEFFLTFFRIINELSKHIQRAINELPPTYREAFIMHRFQNLSYKEAAELLNVSPKTVAVGAEH